jgi:hypothetical protein
MSFRKTFVCLARSRKNGGCCIAGKTASPSGYGNWIRPTGTSPGGALIERETCLDDGSTAALLDLVTVHLQEKDEEIDYQAENYRICRGIPWKKEGAVQYGKLADLADKPEMLWKNNYSSGAGMNDFVPVSMLGGTVQSLYLIRPIALKLLTEPPREPGRPLAVRAKFIYGGVGYNLKVTDLRFSGMKRNEIETLDLQAAFLTISLGLPFTPESRSGSVPECYKLVAAVLLPQFFAS